MPAAAHTSEPDDAEALLQRCARGDRAAFRLLYDRWGSRLYGIALRITRQGASAAADVSGSGREPPWRRWRSPPRWPHSSCCTSPSRSALPCYRPCPVAHRC
jgi:RNA polymerase sigma-70 factor (ECF subfamily)